MMNKLTSAMIFVLVFILSETVFSQWSPIGPDSGEVSLCLSFDNSTGNLFLGTAEGFWYYNTLSGSWTRREDVGWIGRSVYAIAAHQSIPGRIITGRVNAFFKGYVEYTNDWGVTGTPAYMSNGGNVTDVKSVPGSPNAFFACTWSDISPGELLKSTDGGLNWILHPNYIHYTMTEIAIDKINPSVMYVSGDERVTKSTDGGTTWTVSSTGLPSGLGVYSVAVSHGNNQVLLCSNDNGIYRSTNAGASWTQVYSAVCRHFEFNPADPNYVAAVTFSPYKVLLSTNAGASWSDFTSNLTGDLSDISFNSTGTKLYAASRMDGVFIHDFSFVPVELVSFNATAGADGILLEWKTSTELNNKGFEIERTTEGKAWSTIGFVKGAGTTSAGTEYSFLDESVYKMDAVVKYRLKQVDFDGSFLYSPEAEVISTAPYQFTLEQNYPNPFNPTTTIRYSLGADQPVELVIYDMLGKEIRTLVNELQSAGVHQISFDASELTSGVYVYKIKAGGFSSFKKMTLLK